jgi:LacI family transcriptional regulator
VSTSWDIAREAGVSQATVSRVLNDDPRVADATRQRVRAVIERRGYEPNAIARGLATRRSQLVGVIVSDITNPFYPELLEAITQRLGERGLKMILFNAWQQDENDVVKLLLGHRVDGIIFTSALLDSTLVRDLVARRFPLVLANRYVDEVPCDAVLGNNAQGAEQAAQHLLDLGHRKIAAIVGHTRSSTSRDRMRAFRTTLVRAGVSIREEFTRDGEFRFELAYAETLALLRLPDPPTAIFCVNDLMALGAMSAAKHLGIAVPEQVSILGFDDIPMASWDVFRLTTVRQPLPEMARAAVDLLASRVIDVDRTPQTLVFASSLVNRATTAPPAFGARRAAPRSMQEATGAGAGTGADLPAAGPLDPSVG